MMMRMIMMPIPTSRYWMMKSTIWRPRTWNSLLSISETFHLLKGFLGRKVVHVIIMTYLLQTNRTCVSQGEKLSHRKIHFKRPLGTFYNISQCHQHHPQRSTITSLVKSTKTRAMGEAWVTSAFRASWEPSKTRRSFSIVIEWLLFRCFGTFDPFQDFVVSEILHSLLLDSD